MLAVQTAAVTAAHSADAVTNLSLITVDPMFVESTHIGVRRDAGWATPGRQRPETAACVKNLYLHPGAPARCGVPSRRRRPKGVTVLEHTVDAGLPAEGPTLEACLARAGAGMFALFLEPPHDAPTTVEIRAAEETADELLVSWLEELLVASELDGIAP